MRRSGAAARPGLAPLRSAQPAASRADASSILALS
jgi:hypothetical protein